MAEKKQNAKVSNRFPKATEKDFEIIIKPIVTEKTMSLMQEQNKVTVKVLPGADKVAIKLAFERIFQVKVDDVKVSNVKGKVTTRGTRYTGSIPGYRKAIVSVANGEAIDLFKD